jgi:hypothetical protein
LLAQPPPAMALLSRWLLGFEFREMPKKITC